MTNENFKQEFNPVGHLSETQLTKSYKERFGKMDKAEQLERIATAAMQGLLSIYGAHGIENHEDIASDAVKSAKALINELNKES